MTEAAAAVEPTDQIEDRELEPASKRLDSRRDMMREIANNARKAREADLAPEDIQETPPVDETIQESVETAAEVVPPEKVPDEPPLVAKAPEPPPEPPKPELIAFNLDGSEYRVTLEQAREMLAAKTRADAEFKAQEERHTELVAMQAAAPKPQPDLLPLAREAVSAILDSTEDEAAAKLVTVLDNLRPEPQRIDTESLIEQAANRAAEKARAATDQEIRQHAISQFRAKRSDIFDDEFLYLGFDRAATKYHDEHPNALPEEVLAKAAESVDNWKSQFAPASPPADMEFAEKEKRKAAATENVSQISRRQQPPPEKAPMTASQIIAAKQKQRGRTQY